MLTVLVVSNGGGGEPTEDSLTVEAERAESMNPVVERSCHRLAIRSSITLTFNTDENDYTLHLHRRLDQTGRP